MNARDQEQASLDVCREIAMGEQVVLENEQQANVVYIAAMLCRTSDANISARLQKVAAVFFANNPEEQLSTQQTLQRGWIISLPRFRSMLERHLGIN